MQWIESASEYPSTTQQSVAAWRPLTLCCLQCRPGKPSGAGGAYGIWLHTTCAVTGQCRRGVIAAAGQTWRFVEGCCLPACMPACLPACRGRACHGTHQAWLRCCTMLHCGRVVAVGRGCFAGWQHEALLGWTCLVCCMTLCTHTHTHARTHAHAHTHAYIHTHTHTHTHTHVAWLGAQVPRNQDAVGLHAAPFCRQARCNAHLSIANHHFMCMALGLIAPWPAAARAAAAASCSTRVQAATVLQRCPRRCPLLPLHRTQPRLSAQAHTQL